MHPLRRYVRNLKIAADSPDEYNAKLERLASYVGVSVSTIYRVYRETAKGNKLTPTKALRLELATGGAVPATSVCDHVGEVIDLVNRVAAMHENLEGAHDNGEDPPS